VIDNHGTFGSKAVTAWETGVLKAVKYFLRPTSSGKRAKFKHRSSRRVVEGRISAA
jgi:hypothetical protein